MPQPFPIDRLPTIPAAALAPLRSVARACRAPRGGAAALDALRTVLGEVVHVGVVDVSWVEPTVGVRLPDALVALRVELGGGVVIVELEPTTAIAMIDAALGLGADADPVAARPLGAAELGVLAYLGARVVLTARPYGGRVLGWTTDPRDLAAALAEEPHVAIRLDVALRGHVLGARLWLPARGVVAPEVPPDPTSFAALPVTVCCAIGGVQLEASDAAHLRAGDVVLLDHALARPEGDGLVGRAALRVAGARAPWFVGAILDGRSIRVESMPGDREVLSMAHKQSQEGEGALGPLAGEIPVEVVVELGRLVSTVGELSALAPGEVVTLDRAVADPVTLSAGGRAIARGELVLVEGRVGVRILDVTRR